MPREYRHTSESRRSRPTIGGQTLTTTPKCSGQMIIKYREMIIAAARGEDRSIVDLVTNETWQRIKLHGVPLSRYLTASSAGLDRLRDELEAENGGLKIPLTIRWLGRAEDINRRWKEGQISSSSVTFAVKGEGIAERIVQNGIRVAGVNMRASFFVVAGPGYENLAGGRLSRETGLVTREFTREAS